MESQGGSVGHIISSFLSRTQNWIYNQIQFQAKYRSIVLAQKLDRREHFPYERVYAMRELPGWRWLVERGVRKLVTGYYPYHYQIARKQQVRLLQAHFGRAGLHSLRLANTLDVPLITSFYGSDMSKRSNGRANLESEYAPLFEAGDLFLVEGPAAKEQLKVLGCPTERIIIQRLGVDLEKIPYRSRQVADGAPIRILMAATFAEKKGMPYGVEAFCQAARETPRLRLTVVGDARATKPEEEGIKRQLRDLVAQYDMGTRVSFLGYVRLNQLRELAYTHHIFLHPSVIASTGDNEGGSPVVITEMAASGLPVISSHHCDIPHAVLDGTTGVLTDERNVEQLRLALIQLATDDRLRLQMAKQGREHVAEHFSAKRQGHKLGEIYREVLGG